MRPTIAFVGQVFLVGICEVVGPGRRAGIMRSGYAGTPRSADFYPIGGVSTTRSADGARLATTTRERPQGGARTIAKGPRAEPLTSDQRHHHTSAPPRGWMVPEAECSGSAVPERSRVAGELASIRVRS